MSQPPVIAQPPKTANPVPSIDIPEEVKVQSVATPTSAENSARAGMEAPQLTKAQKKKLKEKKSKLINSVKEQIGKEMTEETAGDIA